MVKIRLTKLYNFLHISDTTPPKKQIKDMSQDFYSAGFAPGAIVYFSYDLPKGYIFDFELNFANLL